MKLTNIVATLSIICMMAMPMMINIDNASGEPSYYEETTDFSTIDDVRSLNTNSIVSIKSDYVSQPEDANKINQIVSTGTPVIMNKNYEILLESGLPVVADLGSDFVAVYCSPEDNVMHSNCASGIDAKEQSIIWANNVVNSKTDSAVGNIGIVADCRHTIYTKAGHATVASSYTKLGTFNGQTYYKANYVLQSCPKNEYRTADMTITSDIDAYNGCQRLVAYGPTTTVGSNTESSNVSFTSGIYDASIGTSVGWSYSVPDVIIHDKSEFATQFFKLWHDVNEDRNVGKDTYTIAPGAIVSVPENSVYRATDVYEVDYLKKGWWSTSHVTATIKYTVAFG